MASVAAFAETTHSNRNALPDSLLDLARDVRLLSYQPSDDVCVQIVRKFSFRSILDALNSYSYPAPRIREDDEDDDEDDEEEEEENAESNNTNNANNLEVLCELVAKLSKCDRVIELLLFPDDAEDERGSLGGGCAREEVLGALAKGITKQDAFEEGEDNLYATTLTSRACAVALMEIMKYCARRRGRSADDDDDDAKSGATADEIFVRLLPDVLEGMLETSDERVLAALETAACAAVGEGGKIGERRRMRVKEMVLEMAATGKCAHSSSVAKSRALTALAALSSDYSEGGEREGNEKEEIVRRKEIEAFEDTTRESVKCKDALLLAVTLESLGELCERDRRVAMKVFRSDELREVLFKNEKNDDEENEKREEERSMRIASLTCAARVCGSAVIVLTTSDSNDIRRDNTDTEDAISFETCASIFVENATAMSSNRRSSDESAAAADALGTFCAIALSPSSSAASFAIVQALMLSTLDILTTRSFYKSCVASIHALANASFYPAEIMQKTKTENSQLLQSRFKKLKIVDGTASRADSSTITFEKQLRMSCYSASSYRGTPAEAIAKALANTPGIRGNENDVQKRIALYRLAQSLGTRAWFARDCLMSSSTEALIGSKNCFEPTSEAMRWRMSALKAIAIGAMEARALDMIDESQYIQIKSASEMNAFLGVGGVSKATAIPDVATLPR